MQKIIPIPYLVHESELDQSMGDRILSKDELLEQEKALDEELSDSIMELKKLNDEMKTT